MKERAVDRRGLALLVLETQPDRGLAVDPKKTPAVDDPAMRPVLRQRPAATLCAHHFAIDPYGGERPELERRSWADFGEHEFEHWAGLSLEKCAMWIAWMSRNVN